MRAARYVHSRNGFRSQIVAVADTGLDMNNCFFNDPGVSPPYDTVNLAHRKVAHASSFGVKG